MLSGSLEAGVGRRNRVVAAMIALFARAFMQPPIRF